MEPIKNVINKAKAIADDKLSLVERTKYSGIAISVKDMQEIKRALLAAQVLLSKCNALTGDISWPDLEILQKCEVGKTIYRVGFDCPGDRYADWKPVVKPETITNVDGYGAWTSIVRDAAKNDKHQGSFGWHDIGQTVFFDKEDAQKLSDAVLNAMRNWKVGDEIYFVDNEEKIVYGPYKISRIGGEGITTENGRFSWTWPIILKRINDIFFSKDDALKELERRLEAAC